MVKIRCLIGMLACLIFISCAEAMEGPEAGHSTKTVRQRRKNRGGKAIKADARELAKIMYAQKELGKNDSIISGRTLFFRDKSCDEDTLCICCACLMGAIATVLYCKQNFF